MAPTIIQSGDAMAQITLKGNPVQTAGMLPAVGSTAPDFTLVAEDLSEAHLATFGGKKKIFNIFVSMDTGICANSLKTFHDKLANRDDVVVLNISADLPFAAKRFCAAEGVENAVTLSTFRSKFGEQYGLEMIDGALAGLNSRSVIVVDENDQVTYVEQVPEIGQEPDYDAAIAAL